VPGVPGQREQLKRKIRAAPGLSRAQVKQLLGILKELPDDDRLCHGDLHPANVLLAAGGPVLIDWIDATSGNPLADVARSSIILGGAEARAAASDRVLADFVRRFVDFYLTHYFELKGSGREEYEAWRPIVAAARLSEGIEDLQEWLLGQVQVGLR
jgi:aminoglycoside phosphotransferase (APT) family kinase protein